MYSIYHAFVARWDARASNAREPQHRLFLTLSVSLSLLLSLPLSPLSSCSAALVRRMRHFVSFDVNEKYSCKCTLLHYHAPSLCFYYFIFFKYLHRNSALHRVCYTVEIPQSSIIIYFSHHIIIFIIYYNTIILCINSFLISIINFLQKF